MAATGVVGGERKGRQKSKVAFHNPSRQAEDNNNNSRSSSHHKAFSSPLQCPSHMGPSVTGSTTSGRVVVSSPLYTATDLRNNKALLQSRKVSQSLSTCECERAPPPGLLNLGKTCSFNVLLQALAATRTFSGLYGGLHRVKSQKDSKPSESSDHTPDTSDRTKPRDVVYLHRLARRQRGLLTRYYRQAAHSRLGDQEEEKRERFQDGRCVWRDKKVITSRGESWRSEEEDGRGRRARLDEVAVAAAAERAVNKSDTPLNYCVADILGRMSSSSSGKICCKTARLREEEEIIGRDTSSVFPVDTHTSGEGRLASSSMCEHTDEGRCEDGKPSHQNLSHVADRRQPSHTTSSPSLLSSSSSSSASSRETAKEEESRGGDKQPVPVVEFLTKSRRPGTPSPAVIVDVDDDDDEGESRSGDGKVNYCEKEGDKKKKKPNRQQQQQKKGDGKVDHAAVHTPESSSSGSTDASVIEVCEDSQEKQQAVRRQMRLQRQLQTKRWWVKKPEEEQNVLYPVDFVSQMRTLNSDFQQDTELDVEEVWRFLVDQIFTELQQQERRINSQGVSFSCRASLSSAAAVAPLSPPSERRRFSFQSDGYLRSSDEAPCEAQQQEQEGSLCSPVDLDLKFTCSVKKQEDVHEEANSPLRNEEDQKRSKESRGNATISSSSSVLGSQETTSTSGKIAKEESGCPCCKRTSSSSTTNVEEGEQEEESLASSSSSSSSLLSVLPDQQCTKRTSSCCSYVSSCTPVKSLATQSKMSPESSCLSCGRSPSCGSCSRINCGDDGKASLLSHQDRCEGDIHSSLSSSSLPVVMTSLPVTSSVITPETRGVCSSSLTSSSSSLPSSSCGCEERFASSSHDKPGTCASRPCEAPLHQHHRPSHVFSPRGGGGTILRGGGVSYGICGGGGGGGSRTSCPSLLSRSSCGFSSLKGPRCSSFCCCCCSVSPQSTTCRPSKSELLEDMIHRLHAKGDRGEDEEVYCCHDGRGSYKREKNKRHMTYLSPCCMSSSSSSSAASPLLTPSPFSSERRTKDVSHRHHHHSSSPSDSFHVETRRMEEGPRSSETIPHRGKEEEEDAALNQLLVSSRIHDFLSSSPSEIVTPSPNSRSSNSGRLGESSSHSPRSKERTSTVRRFSSHDKKDLEKLEKKEADFPSASSLASSSSLSSEVDRREDEEEEEKEKSDSELMRSRSLHASLQSSSSLFVSPSSSSSSLSLEKMMDQTSSFSASPLLSGEGNRGRGGEVGSSLMMTTPSSSAVSSSSASSSTTREMFSASACPPPSPCLTGTSPFSSGSSSSSSSLLAPLRHDEPDIGKEEDVHLHLRLSDLGKREITHLHHHHCPLQRAEKDRKEDMDAFTSPNSSTVRLLEQVIQHQGTVLLREKLERALIGRLVQVPVPCSCCCRCDDDPRFVSGDKLGRSTHALDDRQKIHREAKGEEGEEKERRAPMRNPSCEKEIQHHQHLLLHSTPCSLSSSFSLSSCLSSPSSLSLSPFPSNKTPLDDSSLSPQKEKIKPSPFTPEGIRRCRFPAPLSSTGEGDGLFCLDTSLSLPSSLSTSSSSDLLEKGLISLDSSSNTHLSLMSSCSSSSSLSSSKIPGVTTEVFCGVLPLRLPERSRWLSSRTRVSLRGSSHNATSTTTPPKQSSSSTSGSSLLSSGNLPSRKDHSQGEKRGKADEKISSSSIREESPRRSHSSSGRKGSTRNSRSVNEERNVSGEGEREGGEGNCRTRDSSVPRDRQRGPSSSSSYQHQQQPHRRNEQSPVTLEECLSLAFDPSASSSSCCDGKERREGTRGDRKIRTFPSPRTQNKGADTSRKRNQRKNSSSSSHRSRDRRKKASGGASSSIVISSTSKRENPTEDPHLVREADEEVQEMKETSLSPTQQEQQRKQDEGCEKRSGEEEKAGEIEGETSLHAGHLSDKTSLIRCLDCGKWKKRLLSSSSSPPPPSSLMSSSPTHESGVSTSRSPKKEAEKTSDPSMIPPSSLSQDQTKKKEADDETPHKVGGCLSDSLATKENLEKEEERDKDDERNPDHHGPLHVSQEQPSSSPPPPLFSSSSPYSSSFMESMICSQCNQLHMKTFLGKLPDLLILQLPRSSIVGTSSSTGIGRYGESGSGASLSVKSSALATAASGRGFKIKAHVEFPKTLHKLLHPHCLFSSSSFRDLCRRSFFSSRLRTDLKKKNKNERQKDIEGIMKEEGEEQSCMKRRRVSRDMMSSCKKERCGERGKKIEKDEEHEEERRTERESSWSLQEERCCLDQTSDEEERLFEEMYTSLLSADDDDDSYLNSPSPRVYTLRAVIEHQGRSGIGGHYVCYRRETPCLEKKKQKEFKKMKKGKVCDSSTSAVNSTSSSYLSSVETSDKDKEATTILTSSSSLFPSIDICFSQTRRTSDHGVPSLMLASPSLSQAQSDQGEISGSQSHNSHDDSSLHSLAKKGKRNSVDQKEEKRQSSSLSSSSSKVETTPWATEASTSRRSTQKNQISSSSSSPSFSPFSSWKEEEKSEDEKEEENKEEEEIWWEVNDAQVTRTSWDRVRLCQAYLLIYEREEEEEEEEEEGSLHSWGLVEESCAYSTLSSSSLRRDKQGRERVICDEVDEEKLERDDVQHQKEHLMKKEKEEGREEDLLCKNKRGEPKEKMCPSSSPADESRPRTGPEGLEKMATKKMKDEEKGVTEIEVKDEEDEIHGESKETEVDEGRRRTSTTATGVRTRSSHERRSSARKRERTATTINGDGRGATACEEKEKKMKSSKEESQEDRSIDEVGDDVLPPLKKTEEEKGDDSSALSGEKRNGEEEEEREKEKETDEKRKKSECKEEKEKKTRMERRKDFNGGQEETPLSPSQEERREGIRSCRKSERRTPRGGVSENEGIKLSPMLMCGVSDDSHRMRSENCSIVGGIRTSPSTRKIEKEKEKNEVQESDSNTKDSTSVVSRRSLSEEENGKRAGSKKNLSSGMKKTAANKVEKGIDLDDEMKVKEIRDRSSPLHDERKPSELGERGGDRGRVIDLTELRTLPCEEVEEEKIHKNEKTDLTPMKKIKKKNTNSKGLCLRDGQKKVEVQASRRSSSGGDRSSISRHVATLFQRTKRGRSSDVEEGRSRVASPSLSLEERKKRYLRSTVPSSPDHHSKALCKAVGKERQTEEDRGDTKQEKKKEKVKGRLLDDDKEVYIDAYRTPPRVKGGESGRRRSPGEEEGVVRTGTEEKEEKDDLDSRNRCDSSCILPSSLSFSPSSSGERSPTVEVASREDSHSSSSAAEKEEEKKMGSREIDSEVGKNEERTILDEKEINGLAPATSSTRETDMKIISSSDFPAGMSRPPSGHDNLVDAKQSIAPTSDDAMGRCPGVDMKATSMIVMETHSSSSKGSKSSCDSIFFCSSRSSKNTTERSSSKHGKKAFASSVSSPRGAEEKEEENEDSGCHHERDIDDSGYTSLESTSISHDNYSSIDSSQSRGSSMSRSLQGILSPTTTGEQSSSYISHVPLFLSSSSLTHLRHGQEQEERREEGVGEEEEENERKRGEKEEGGHLSVGTGLQQVEGTHLSPLLRSDRLVVHTSRGEEEKEEEEKEQHLDDPKEHEEEYVKKKERMTILRPPSDKKDSKEEGSSSFPSSTSSQVDTPSSSSTAPVAINARGRRQGALSTTLGRGRYLLRTSEQQLHTEKEQEEERKKREEESLSLASLRPRELRKRSAMVPCENRDSGGMKALGLSEEEKKIPSQLHSSMSSSKRDTKTSRAEEGEEGRKEEKEGRSRHENVGRPTQHRTYNGGGHSSSKVLRERHVMSSLSCSPQPSKRRRKKDFGDLKTTTTTEGKEKEVSLCSTRRLSCRMICKKEGLPDRENRHSLTPSRTLLVKGSLLNTREEGNANSCIQKIAEKDREKEEEKKKKKAVVKHHDDILQCIRRSSPRTLNTRRKETPSS